MGTILNSQLFTAFLDCPTKCFLRSKHVVSDGNAYADWVRRREQVYVSDYVRHLPERQHEMVTGDILNAWATEWQTAVDVQVDGKDLEANLQLLERINSSRGGQYTELVPTCFTFRNKLTVKDKLLLAFDTLVLSRAFDQPFSQGKIVHGEDYDVSKLKTDALHEKVKKLVSEIQTLLSSDSPALTLNRHCSECEFQLNCRRKAVEQDDLSLLSGMSEKARRNFRDKGINTISNLSFTYRPRRKPKHLHKKGEKYELSLKALAIRDHKIFVVGSERLEIEGTPVYLDVEGIPDRDFYYLIGIRVINGGEVVQRTLWADSVSDEKNMWNKFLEILTRIESPMIIHFGSFESTFLKHMMTDYGGVAKDSDLEKAIKNSTNLLSFIYGRFYFPTYSNGLKDIARYLGFQWTEPEAAGIQTIAWRSDWEDSGKEELKNTLILYNSEDCEALERITNFVVKLSAGKDEPNESQEIQPVNVKDLPAPRSRVFKKIQFQNTSLEEIYRAGYWDYQREKITVRSHHRTMEPIGTKNRPLKTQDKPNKTVYWEKPSECPFCGNKQLSVHRHGDKTLLDVRFGKSGVKKWVTRYIFGRYTCRACDSPTFSNLDPAWSHPHYGPNLKALAIYLNIGLRISESKTASIFSQLLGINIPGSVVHRFKEKAAEYYSPTHQWIQDELIGGNLIHCDETKIILGSEIGFVWAFANAEWVAYVYTRNRGGDLIRTILKDFKGVLVSDFYSFYDSLDCPQQKCLVHLIRDLNDELMNEPFNEEIKQLTADFAGLLRSIIGTIDRFGLKARHLHKHKKEVNIFYSQLCQHTYESETVNKYKKRFEKNRDKLFTFLDYDNVPWNNNNAEHAIKAIAHLRRELGAVSTEKGIEDYLVLLSVRETCKLQGINFLDFLRSREIDLDVFKNGSKPYKQKPFLPLDSEAHFLGV